MNIFQTVRRLSLPAVFLFFAAMMPVMSYSDQAANTRALGPDVILLQIKDAGRPLRMPASMFFHDAHTHALKGKNCSTCHFRDNDRLVFQFKQAPPAETDAKMALYHDECAGCHKKMAARGEKTGPGIAACRNCHVKQPVQGAGWLPFDFDRSLHFRHEKSSAIKGKSGDGDIGFQINNLARSEGGDNTHRISPTDNAAQIIYPEAGKNCEACHHVYDTNLKKTVPAPGREGSCRYCHKDRPIDNTRTFKDAAHDTCVNCHETLAVQKIDTGPVDCAGCHGAEGQARIQDLKTVPRMVRNQPDAVLLAPWLKQVEKTGKLPDRMTLPVAFNHKLHETPVPACRTCHHASRNDPGKDPMTPCDSCHTIAGETDGRNVTLETAIHDPLSGKSCIGCHNARLRNRDCAACHANITIMESDTRQCAVCHSVPKDALTSLPAGKVTQTAVADAAVSARNLQNRPETVSISDKDIPETVTIDVMADQYRQVTMPHRKIIHEIENRINANRLAAVFHKDTLTLCAGCHHNSRPGLTPPKCINCHKINKGKAVTDRPGLKAAYHAQCMDCHRRMGIREPASTDCTVCHKKAGPGAPN